MWLKILGLVAGGIAAALLVGTVAYLTIDALKRHLRQNIQMRLPLKFPR